MGRIEEVGGRESFLARMGWVYGNLFVWVGRILGGSSSMIPVKARKFAFGRMFGVEIGLLGRNFLACTALLV
jgi:hypothetical protein